MRARPLAEDEQGKPVLLPVAQELLRDGAAGAARRR